MNRINANRNRCRCGYRRLQLYCPESSSIMQVSRPLNYNHGVLNTLPPVPDSYIGTVSSSMFAGMMVGAVGWGTCKSTPFSYPDHITHSHQGSDLMGRITAFNATLFLTALFGLLASFTNSFSTLCITLFFLGSSIGVRRS
jgi:hypothetical protein